MRAVDDDEAAATLTYLAVIQIRAMARRRQPFHPWMGDDYVVCIGWLADLVHNLAGPRGRTRRLSRKRRRCMEHTWAVAGETGRRWITDSLEAEGLMWKPPSDTFLPDERDNRA
ncbi:hypothetical protein GCM10009759_67420 [Kitasatospora saccharophila]|uniref:Uncharacterized protein n=1 Tax=Kitasatospora saccharophila TaxID=407973 RepID=A0ABN2XY49_9ACTN